MSTIRSVYVPRGSLQVFARRDEAGRTGVYILLGEDPDVPGRLKIYIGEGDEVLKRIVEHDKDADKDFWDRAVVFVSKDQNLTKAHVRHLEARLIELAARAKRSTLFNKTSPNGGILPEADLADMEEFVSQVRLLLATMGIDALDEADAGPSGAGKQKKPAAAPTFSMTGDGYEAKCSIVDGEFVVQKGSLARKTEAPSLSESSKAKRAEMQSSGVLQVGAAGLLFTQDYAFKSASGAAQVVCGANVNGRAIWKSKDGKTYGDWHEAGIASAAPHVTED